MSLQPRNTSMRLLILILLIYSSLQVSDPVWNVYSPNIMYSGQYQAFLTTKTAGSIATLTQTVYRSGVTPQYTQAPKVMLSLLGYKQAAPPTVDTSVGFDVKITTINPTNFTVVHNIFGATISYLIYMYLTIVQTNTDFFVAQETQVFDTMAVNKTYSLDLANKAGETYSNFGTNKIEMKGFLAGYKLKQGTANGMYLNFTLKVKDSSFFTITVSVNNNSVLESIWYYRIGYDRTVIEKRTYTDIFADFYFQLVNNVNIRNIYNASFTVSNEFQYRNFLMGANMININGTGPVGVEFMLYYYFAQSVFKIDNGTIPFLLNPAKAQYLMGETFYHTVRNCASLSPDLYFFGTNKKCYNQCPDYTMGDASTFTCFSCHFSCKSCSVSGAADKCLSCDTNFRNFDSGSNRCVCPAQKYDDGTNLACLSCHGTCQTCVSSSKSDCKICVSGLNREFSDPDGNGIGDCVCSLSYYEDLSTGSCKSCSAGCLKCTNVGGVESCSSCNATLNLELSNSLCSCKSGAVFLNNACLILKCGDGTVSSSEQCDDNNVVDGDGCSSNCKIQKDHVCFKNVSVSNHSICYFNGSLSMTITQVSKSPYANEVSLSIKIDTSANSAFLKGYLTRSSSIVLDDVTRRRLQKIRLRNLASQTLQITQINFDETSKILFVKFEYSQTFDIRTKKIRFQPSMSTSSENTKYFFNSPEAIVQLQKTYNKIDTIYFDPAQYQKAISLKYAFLVLIGAFWIVSLLMIVIGKSNVAMEMMIVYQVAYVSLLSQEKLDIMMGGFSQFGKYTAGYNIEIFKNQGKCVNFLAIDMGCSMINNLNITFALMIFILLTYGLLKLINRTLNHFAMKAFLRKRHQKYMKENNEQTNQNIDPNMRPQFEVQSESSQAIEQNYYKDQEFIPERVYNVLLDLEYFFMFVTVIVWVLSMCYTNQNILSTIIEGGLLGVLYLSMWVMWVVKYKFFNFSFVEAHKQSQAKYKEDNSQNAQQNNGENQINFKPQQPKQKKVTKKRFTGVIFKVMFYPLIWFGLLGIGAILGLTESVGYVTQAIVITGSILMVVIIWFTQIYKEKLNILRAILNCIFLAVIEILFIVSQQDNLIGSGLAVALPIYVLLSVTLLLNTASTLYLFKVELRLNKKRNSMEIAKIGIQNDQLSQAKIENGSENGGLFFKKNQNQSSVAQQSIFGETHKKDYNFNWGNNLGSYANFMRPEQQSSVNTMAQTLSKQQINEILTQKKLQKSFSSDFQQSQVTIPQGFGLNRFSGSEKNKTHATQITQKKKLFGANPMNQFNSPTKSVNQLNSPAKSAATTKYLEGWSDSHIKIDLSPQKY